MSLHNVYSCFHAFDKNGDGGIDLQEFSYVCNALFRNDRGFIYHLDKDKMWQIFDVFDRDRNGLIDFEEFLFCWHNWFKYIIQPRCVCIVINMQNDWVNGVMSLGATFPEGVEEHPNILEPINIILATCEFESVCYLMDWHPPNHISFFENVNLRPIHASSKVTAEEARPEDTVVFALSFTCSQKLWPKHCVENTFGSELHEGLRIHSKAHRIYTGTNSEHDQLSAFRDANCTENGFHGELKKRNVTDIIVVGIPYDGCVRETCLDALTMGYRTVLVEDCCRVMNPTIAEQTKIDIVKRSGVVVNSTDVKNMVEGKDRRAELGYKLAMKIKDRLRKSRIKSFSTLKAIT